MFGVNLLELQGARDLEIKGVSFDSRAVGQGDVFVAVLGLTVDGHDFIAKAITAGAVAIVCERLPEQLDEKVTYIKTGNSSEALGVLASNFHGNPSSKLALVGITGTNGKTTCVTLLHDLFTRLGYKTGLISTVENKIGDRVLPSKFTTPDAVQLNELLSEMVEQGCTHAFMEVSSHALIQNRVQGIDFKGGVFTNISHDHLDFHKTFEDYIRAKKLLFDSLKREAFALTNVDDKRGKVMLQNTRASQYTFGLKSIADFKGRILSNSIQGLQLDVDSQEVWFQLIGDFNAYNLLAAYGVAMLLGENKEHVLATLSGLKGARGRFEQVRNLQNIIAIVDYAHTPDALENVLKTVDQLRTKNESFITVVGCGGDRDRAKRPEMARIAIKFSDKVILTSDNPRTEDPETILDDMMVGVPKSEQRKVMRITDRREAIKVACSMSQDEDIVLVAGKGHEDYQEINGVRSHFDDREVLSEMLNNS